MWLTGFAGSAGLAVVLKDAAALFVDGRYTEQAKAESDGSVFEVRHVIDEPPAEWIARNLKRGERLGYDPRLHTPDSVARFQTACEKAGSGAGTGRGEPDRRDLAGPAARAARRDITPTRSASPAKARARRSSACDRRSGRHGSVGQRPSQSGVAVQHSRRGRRLYASAARLRVSASSRATDRVRRRAESSPMRAASVSAAKPEILEPDALIAFIEDLGRQGARRLRFRDRPGLPHPGDRAGGRQGGHRRRSDHAHEGGEERGRARRRPRRACARRGGYGEFPRLVRAEAPAGV